MPDFKVGELAPVRGYSELMVVVEVINNQVWVTSVEQYEREKKGKHPAFRTRCLIDPDNGELFPDPKGS